ncbi:MAG TPA: hypothetical protein ENN67_03445, partial [Firmicutes bacterium]|nr:hypothetical protein [Bacillota bacterium]
MKRIAILIVVAAIFSIADTACTPRSPQDVERLKGILEIYNGLLEDYGPYYPDNPGESGWNFNYHPAIYATWVFEGKKNLETSFENKLKEGFKIFSALKKDLQNQISEGGAVVDKERFLSQIENQKLRDDTASFMDQGGILALHAFARAWAEPVISEFPDAPQKMLVMLGRNYTGRPEILLIDPVGVSDPLAIEWRDWLHTAIGACGEKGIGVILEFNRGLDDVNKTIVPFDDFWTGQVTMAYNLRAIQFGKAEALDLILNELGQYRDGGEVGKLHAWMYWDLAWSIHDPGGIYPYSDEDIRKVNEFIN